MKQKMRQFLSQRQKQHIVDANRVPAGVLLPIYCKQSHCYILFTKRTETVKEYKGQMSFPGGAYHEGDARLVNTALRECAEEIGLVAEEVEILGELDDTITANYIISPFVAFIPWPYHFRVDANEVEELLEVPISALLNRGNLPQKTEIIDGEAAPSYFYHYRGRVIWGATARILNQFLDVLTQITEEG